MHVRFTKDFDFSPAAKNGHVTIAYKAGAEENVTRECVKAAAAAGAIERSDEVDALLAEHADQLIDKALDTVFAPGVAEVAVKPDDAKANRRG